ncbi:hypothetical protein C8Q72DRAFT_907368 [Fomitopsis betulina]|nr:hypothetical protein C8Q72DRAFT_907368 [Fomitopsis betulina]
MTATHGFMEMFYGHNTSPRNPGSLAFHNNLLNRKPIVLSSLPSFRECHDLAFVSLYTRVLHCLELVSKVEDLSDYATHLNFNQLKTHVAEIVTCYADGKTMDRLRTARATELRERETRGELSARASETSRDASSGSTEASEVPHDLMQGDMVFENTVLLLCDGLILRLLTDCIKCGDSGRVLLVLKVLALYYRGCGWTKYAQGVLFLILNFKHVWPEPLQGIVLKNWLVNPTGKANSWVEVDLLQEHLNFWIKTIYKAHGSSASWEWLAMISPCVDVLRRLAAAMNSSLGAQQGTKHTTPSLEQDIAHLQESLCRFRVYEVIPGHKIDDGSDNPVVPDSLTLGLQCLWEPLKEFNATFAKLQACCRAPPLIGNKYMIDDTSVTTASHEGDAEDDTDDDAESSEDEGSGTDSDGEDVEDDLAPQQTMSLDNAGDVSLDMDDLSADDLELLPPGACTIINHGRNLEVITTTLKIYQDLVTALPKILTAIKQLQARGRKGKAQEGEADSGAEEDE